MPQLVELREQLSQDLRVVAVSLDGISPLNGPQDNASIAALAAKRGFESLDLVLYAGDPTDLKAEPWDLPSGIPFSLVLDADGRGAARHEGPLDLAGLRDLVSNALDK